VKRVALLGEEYVGMRPAMAVKEGDRVKNACRRTLRRVARRASPLARKKSAVMACQLWANPAPPAVKRVALLGEEYVGMRPAMAVKEGDRVKKGQIQWHASYGQIQPFRDFNHIVSRYP
jgi:hypothetical protein